MIFAFFNLQSLENGFGKVIAMCIKISRLYFYKAIITHEIHASFIPQNFPATRYSLLVELAD